MSIKYDERAVELVRLSSAEFETICQQAFQSTEGFTDLAPLTHGGVNTTYRFSWNGESYVLRLYIRDPSLCTVEMQILERVKSHVSVPETIYFNASGQPYPYAIFRFVEGKHLFEISNPSITPKISYELGYTLAKIHLISFNKAGLFGPNMTIQTCFEKGSSPYYQYIKEYLVRGSVAWRRLGDPLAEKVLLFIDQYQNYFPTIIKGGVLVHSDFKPVNLLYHQANGVTVLDWEFAHSGCGLLDFGILLRHFQDFPLDISELEKGYTDQGGVLQDQWIKRARITDLVNIIQLLDRAADRSILYEALINSLMLTLEHWESLEETIKKAMTH